jgi:glycerol-1-phosphate dehydrogenase [NAD(P)+]
MLRGTTPNRQTAENFINTFDASAWEAMVRRIFGGAAEAILKTARAEGRNDKAAHARRLQLTLDHWQDILRIADEELPPLKDVENIMRFMGCPTRPSEIGFDARDTHDALLGSREIRNKYLTSSLLWDLGLLYTLPFPPQEMV